MDRVRMILEDMLRQGRIDSLKIEEALEHLEGAKAAVDDEDDAAIDRLDEMQDYLEYLLTVDELLESETVKEELAELIEELHHWQR